LKNYLMFWPHLFLIDPLPVFSGYGFSA